MLNNRASVTYTETNLLTTSFNAIFSDLKLAQDTVCHTEKNAVYVYKEHFILSFHKLQIWIRTVYLCQTVAALSGQ